MLRVNAFPSMGGLVGHGDFQYNSLPNEHFVCKQNPSLEQNDV